MTRCWGGALASRFTPSLHPADEGYTYTGTRLPRTHSRRAVGLCELSTSMRHQILKLQSLYTSTPQPPSTPGLLAPVERKPSRADTQLHDISICVLSDEAREPYVRLPWCAARARATIPSGLFFECWRERGRGLQGRGSMRISPLVVRGNALYVFPVYVYITLLLPPRRTSPGNGRGVIGGGEVRKYLRMNGGCGPR